MVPSPAAESPRRVLAVRGGALGDFILTLPALGGLREAGFEVQLLTRSAYGQLAQDFGLVSGWRSLEAPAVASLLVRGAHVDAAWRDWLAGFDSVISWLPDQDGAFQQQILACGVKRFHQGDWRCAGPAPAARQLAAVIESIGARFDDRVDLLAGQHALPEAGGNQIAFHPGSGSPRKNWPLERWLTVIQQVQRVQPETRWLVITGEAESDRLPSIRAAWDASSLPWESLHGLELSALTNRLRTCGGFLGHDSGISHLAAVCGVPCRLLFGPTDPAVWAPLGDDVQVLRAEQGNLENLGPVGVWEWLKPLLIKE
ncbi:MAG: glycosyltransferase family 9 protein [Verrucomicrobiota bacterium]